MTSIKLTKPIVDGPRVYTELTVREPTAKQMVELSRKIHGDEYEGALSVISTMTGIDAKLLDGQLGARDFIRLSAIMADYFREDPKNG